MNRFKAAYLALRNPVLVHDGIVVQDIAHKLNNSFAIINAKDNKLQVIPLSLAQRALIRNTIPAFKLQK